MFTNNYIVLRKSAFTYKSGSYKVSSGSSQTGYLGCLGQYDIGGYMTTGRCKSITTTSSKGANPSDKLGAGVYFGSGSTPATKSDYTLESPITSGLAITNPSALVYNSDTEAGIYECCADFIVRNTSETEVNIHEIGVFSAISSYNYSYKDNDSNIWWLTLMERTVLDEPVTIPAGESRLITYKLVFNQS